MNELNKKLLEFAGFKYISGVPVPYYIDPEGNAITRSSDIPAFTDPALGIAYCFKWLIPGVYKHFIKKEAKTLIPGSSSHRTHEWAKHEFCKFLEDWIEGLIFPAHSWEEFNKEPALALCKAFGQVIDAENSKEQL